MEEEGFAVGDSLDEEVAARLGAPLVSRRAGERAEFFFDDRRRQCEPGVAFAGEFEHDSYGGGGGRPEPDEAAVRPAAWVAEPDDEGPFFCDGGGPGVAQAV
ncbi:hypothetical protein SDC9_183222 [bioreactor metagenome]|uniref:Uncharacterized protein n=1 Tax=bioreactor metagenome TaxID=1076179 RepID=A0A645HHY4_9ZZZZ